MREGLPGGEYLLAFHGRARDSPAREVPETREDEPPKPFVLPLRNTDDRRAFAYLRKRGIALRVIRRFLESGLLYEDAVHHNCVFVGRDGSGQARYAGLRGTYDRDGKGFRGDVSGSEKDIGFSIPYDAAIQRVWVFESPIDLMSYLTLHRRPINAVALCGLYDGALRTYLRERPGVQSIVLCLDVDRRGREAVRQLREKYSGEGCTVTVKEPAAGKDWNEYLEKLRSAGREVRAM